jgi:hypothetical protein
VAQQDLKAAKDETSMKEQEFHKELNTARKLAQLYKEAEGERCKKVAELEGIILELQKHLKASSCNAMLTPSLHGFSSAIYQVLLWSLSHCASCTGGQHNDEAYVVD